MLRIFRRRKDKPSIMYAVFQKVCEAAERRQRRFCEWLNQKAKGLSEKQLRLGFLIFCALYIACIGIMLFDAFTTTGKSITIKSIQLPVMIGPGFSNDSASRFSK